MRAREFLNELATNPPGEPGDTVGNKYGGLVKPNQSLATVKNKSVATTGSDSPPPPDKQVGQPPAVAGQQQLTVPGTSLTVPNVKSQPSSSQPAQKKYDNSDATDIDFREVPKGSTTTAPATNVDQNPTTTPVAQKAAAAAAAPTTAPTAPSLGAPSATASTTTPDAQQRLASLSANAYPQQKVPGKSTGFLAGIAQGFKQGMGGREGETYAQLAARKAAGGLGLNATAQAIGSLPKPGTKLKDPELGDIEVLPNDPAHNNMMAVKTKDGRKIFVDPKDI